MQLKRMLLASAGLFGMFATQAAAAPLPIAQAAKLFAARTSAFGVDLSPSGRKLLYQSAGPGAVSYLHVRDVVTGQDQVALKMSGKPERLGMCGFAGETWAACYLQGEIHKNGMIMSITRLIGVNLTTGAVRRLGVAENSLRGGFVQSDGNIIDWLPEKDGRILAQRTYPGAGEYGQTGMGVDEIELETFKVSPMIHSAALPYHYYTDGHGALRIRVETLYNEGGYATGTRRYSYRQLGKTNWDTLIEVKDDFAIAAVDQRTNSIYVLKPLDGRDALYRIALDGTKTETFVASHPKVDIDGVLRGGADNAVVGYSFTDDRDRSVYFDPASKSLANSLQRAVPDLPLIYLVGQDRSGSKIVLHASSDRDPGAYFLLDQSKKEMTQLLSSNAAINPSMIAPMKAVDIPMSDGKTIPGYMTAAADLGPGPHPAVIVPHGGPTSRDSWGYDWLAQFLASRGYVVLQPNYRGSAGYGDDFLGENAFKGWRQVMSDLRDSADWLAKQGIADGNRMCIVGWSYGGYAALESASMDPRYKAVVAVAPVTDLKLLRAESAWFVTSKLQKEEIGKGDIIADGSPINRVGSIKAPVLLAHGTLDGNVSYNHSKRMAAALSKAGTPVDFLTFEDLDHQLDDSEAREQLLLKIGQLLDKTIGR